MEEESASETKPNPQDCCPKSVLRGLSLCLTLCLAITLGCLGGVSYFLYDHIRSETEFTCPEFPIIELQCVEPQCILSSAEISEFVDNQIDPCEDFHGFVCDKFMKNAYEKQMSSPLKAQHDQMENRINKFIIEPESKDDLQPVILQKKYFQACLREDAMEVNSNIVFINLINKIGGWPLLKGKKWREKDFDWVKVMRKSRELGLPFEWFLNVDVYDDDNYYYPKISRPKDCEAFGGTSTMGYKEIITQFISRTKGYNSHLMNKTSEIFKFENRLGEICALVKNEPLINATALELERLCKQIKLCSGVKKFLNDLTGLSDNLQLYSVVFYDGDYLIRLNELLNNTPKEILANYIGWKVFENFAPYLSQTTRDEYFDLQEISNRFQFCLTDTKTKFRKVAETVHIRKQASPAIKDAGLQLVSSIKEEFLDQIKDISWMNNDTKEKYSETFNNMETVIGGPDLMFEDKIFEEYLYTGKLNFSSSNIIQMILEWSKATFSAKMESIGKPSITRLLESAYEANRASEIHLVHGPNLTIFLPATIFHGTTYDLNRPQYLNYGSLGTLIAERLATVFHLDRDASGDKNYGKIQKCLMKSLELEDDQLHRNDAIVTSNFADLWGRNVAYRAYQKFIEENGEELTLASNVSYSANQLFWLKSSMNWCYQQLPNEESSLHTQEMLKYRNIETLKHSQFFAEDFECKNNSPMNPSKKCVVF